MPRDAVGHAFIEIADAADAQQTDAPPGVELHWLVRDHGERPGVLALETIKAFELPAGEFHAYVVGEQALPTSLRRFLVNERGVPKSHVTFCGYWR